MSIGHSPNRVGLPILLVALSVLSMAFVGSLRPVSAAPSGTYFDHIVIIAMENTPYASVFGSGTLASCPTSSAPFLCSMLPVSSTVPSMGNYGATAADANDFNGCSAACYVGFMFGYTYGVADGYSFSSISGNPQFVNTLSANGLSWQAYCESGCPRGADHFPFSGSNTFTSSSVSTSTFISAANSATPPNFLWYTPTDSHNMHDVSVSTGDSYLQSFLVGSGSISSPASGSLLASNVFTNPSYRTLLYLWWDECGGSNGSCDSNNDAPNLQYGSPVKKGYVSPDTTGIDEYASLWTIENNWGFAPLAQGDTAAKNSNYQFNDIFGSSTPPPLSASFTYLPGSPVASSPVSFTAVASGGTAPYSYSWNFGDSGTGTGLTTAHTYTSSGSYSVTLTASDSKGGSATSTQTVQVAPVPALSASFTFNPSQPTTGQSVAFTGSGTGGSSPYSFSWNFGDGATSTVQSPSHTYPSAGSYTVGLTITDAVAATASVSYTVTVSPPGALAASFTTNPTAPVSGQTVTFTASASGGSSPYSYRWNLGGTSKTGNPVSQSFTSGTYTISLTVTDSASSTATSSRSLVVLPTPPPASQTVTLAFQGYDFDGAGEDTLAVNGVVVASIPPALTVANGGTWVPFSFDITSYMVQGTNTVSFTHANSDCSYSDQVNNLVVSNQTSAIYSNATVENVNTATNCTNTLTYVLSSVVSQYVLPTITVPGPQSATVGGTLHFTVSATDQNGGTVSLGASGLVSNMAFDPATGSFSFTPSQSQAGQTYAVNFTATDSNNPSMTRTESVPIHVAGATTQPSGGGLCLSCYVPKSMTTTAWLLVLGVLMGIVGSIAALHVRTSMQLSAVRRRMNSLEENEEEPWTYENSRRIVAQPRSRRYVDDD